MAITKVSRGLLNTGVSDSSDATAITIDSSENCTFTGTTTTTGYVIGNNTALFDDHSTLSAYSDTNGVYLNGKNAGWLSLSGDGTQRNNIRIYGQTSSSGEIIQFKTANSERMKIDSSGNLFLGTTSGLGKFNMDFSSVFGKVFKYTGSTATIFPIVFDYGSSTAGSISITSSATSFNTSSDYRLKENINYEFDALSRVTQLKPARFNFIVDADKTVDGFLAHEVSDIVPEAITGEKDGEQMQGIDQSKLVPLLTKAIQEQQEQIEALQSEINTLKGE